MIYRSAGWRGFFVAFSPCLLRATFSEGIGITVYENSREFIWSNRGSSLMEWYWFSSNWGLQTYIKTLNSFFDYFLYHFVFLFVEIWELWIEQKVKILKKLLIVWKFLLLLISLLNFRHKVFFCFFEVALVSLKHWIIKGLAFVSAKDMLASAETVQTKLFLNLFKRNTIGLQITNLGCCNRLLFFLKFVFDIGLI